MEQPTPKEENLTRLMNKPQKSFVLRCNHCGEDVGLMHVRLDDNVTYSTTQVCGKCMDTKKY